MPAQQSAPTAGKSATQPASPTASYGKAGAQHGTQTSVRSPGAPNMMSLTNTRALPATGQGGIAGVSGSSQPIYSPLAQGHHGMSSAQQNPNQGGASSSPTSITNPSTTRGGMGA